MIERPNPTSAPETSLLHEKGVDKFTLDDYYNLLLKWPDYMPLSYKSSWARGDSSVLAWVEEEGIWRITYTTSYSGIEDMITGEPANPAGSTQYGSGWETTT